VELLSEEFRRLDQQTQPRAASISRIGIGANWNSSVSYSARTGLRRLARWLVDSRTRSALPMGVIRVRAESLQNDETTSADSRVKLGIIVRQIDRIARIVRMLLDYARKSESHKAVCDLRTIAERAMTLLEPEAARRGVRTVARLGEDSVDGKLRRRSARAGFRQPDHERARRDESQRRNPAR